MVIHVFGLVQLTEWLIRHRPVGERKHNTWRSSALLAAAFFIIILLHLTEISIWAAFYDFRGHFADFETGAYFSLACYTTIGYGDVMLPPKWRLMGGLEGITGMLLCGLSTAFLFTIVKEVIFARVRRRIDSDASVD